MVAREIVTLAGPGSIPVAHPGVVTRSGSRSASSRTTTSYRARIAGMRLLKPAMQPTAMPTLVITISRESMPDAWRDYLYWTGELEQD